MSVYCNYCLFVIWLLGANPSKPRLWNSCCWSFQNLYNVTYLRHCECFYLQGRNLEHGRPLRPRSSSPNGRGSGADADASLDEPTDRGRHQRQREEQTKRRRVSGRHPVHRLPSRRTWWTVHPGCGRLWRHAQESTRLQPLLLAWGTGHLERVSVRQAAGQGARSLGRTCAVSKLINFVTGITEFPQIADSVQSLV